MKYVALSFPTKLLQMRGINAATRSLSRRLGHVDDPVAGIKIWQAFKPSKPLSHSKLSKPLHWRKKDLSVASWRREEVVYTLTWKDLMHVFSLQSCSFYLMFTSEALILAQFSNDTDLDVPFFPCLARAMPFRISDTSCIANVSATSCYVQKRGLRWNPMKTCIAYNYLQILHDCSPFAGS